jgi:hypothetical protein
LQGNSYHNCFLRHYDASCFRFYKTTPHNFIIHCCIKGMYAVRNYPTCKLIDACRAICVSLQCVSSTRASTSYTSRKFIQLDDKLNWPVLLSVTFLCPMPPSNSIHAVNARPIRQQYSKSPVLHQTQQGINTVIILLQSVCPTPLTRGCGCKFAVLSET